MTTDPLLLMGEVDAATSRLLRTAASFDAADLAAASLLPGWTRGHVLAHVARNADGFVNLLTAARTGEALPMYASLDGPHRGHRSRFEPATGRAPGRPAPHRRPVLRGGRGDAGRGLGGDGAGA